MLNRILPFLDWFKDYSVGKFRIDFLAGLTVALVLIPQSMAYAQLAGLPPYYGLYAAFLPPMVASLFGSSRQLATGPVAVVSLMTSASLSPLATAGSESFVVYAILLALLVGIFQFCLGLLRLGLVVNFLSHPVVNGFTNAAAFIIATSQLSKIFGVSVDEAPHHYETIIRVIKAATTYTHWPTFFMGVLAFGIMYGLKRLAPKLPNVLVAVVLTTVISWAIGFQHNADVNISALKSAKAQELIMSFNIAVNTIPGLAEERTKVSARLEKAKESHDNLSILEAEHDENVISIKLERAKDEAHRYREQIRALLFAGVAGSSGSLEFYLKDQIPADVKSDGRTWCVKVGNNPIKTDKIAMNGGGSVVGEIPGGLPSFNVPEIKVSVIMHLLPFAAIISLLGFMEAISIAKAMAAKTGQRLDPNQELIGQGVANALGAFGQSYPTSGSFSRSAVNLQAGAVTGMSSVFTSLTVVIVLLFFTPLLYHLPQSVLAAVIMMAVVGLINVSGFIHAWKAQWYDGAISIITCFFTLLFAPHLDKGIMIGVILSISVFLYKSMRPTVASLARHEDQAFRCISTHELSECKYISMVRFDGPLFFANSSYLEDKITELMLKKENLRHIIIVCNGINDIDASGEETLSLLVDRIRSAGIDLSLSGVNESVMKVLKRMHFPEKIGEDHVYATMEKAIRDVHSKTHRDVVEEYCPLLTVGHAA
ncbi:Sulfate permease [uncultured Desulfobacterium sp.]|uniref:Sulfate permease n=1 Tax=uncultured Desulfobacterium sp. TaxID=201089 RepID=A0A445N2B6_9BACT|nr:Sulfate permease [uncultured Desulfobacterium sp.]